MALFPTLNSEVLLLSYMVKKITPDNPILRLFINNPSPFDNTINASDLTEPTTYPGYANTTCTGASWSTTTVSGVTTIQYAEQTFSFTTGASVYGYYLTNAAGALLWVEMFSGAPFNLPGGGGVITVTPKATLN